MRTLILLLLFLAVSLQFSKAQNQAPVAVADTIEAIAQAPLMIDVIANDYDPDGDSIYIVAVHSYTGAARIEDGMVWFKPAYFSGEQIFRYTISDGNLSSTITVSVFCSINPDAPISIPDTFDLIQAVPDTLDLLINDNDPNGDFIKIYKISQTSGCQVTINSDSLSVTVIPAFTNFSNFEYQITEIGPDSLLSQKAKVLLYAANNPDRPIAISDTASTTGGISIDIPVLVNDYDPQGEPIRIQSVGDVDHGTIQIVGDIIRYTPYLSYAGDDIANYYIEEVNDPGIYSKQAWIKLTVSQNPHCPVGLPDTASGMSAVPVIIDVLANDYDPDGDSIQVKSVTSTGFTAVITADNKIQYKSPGFITGWDSIYYYVGEFNNPESYSRMVKVMIYLEPNPAFPWAVNDSVTTYAGFQVKIDPLENDIKNGHDSLSLYLVGTGNEQNQTMLDTLGNSVYYTPSFQSEGMHEIYYLMKPADSSLTYAARGIIYVNVLKLNFSDSLTVNNINAGVSANGDLFSDSFVFPGNQNGNYDKPHFNFPSESKIGTVFYNSFILGGINNDNLHLSSGVLDWQHGPVSNVIDSAYLLRYSNVWKLTKAQIEYHKENYLKPDYEPVTGIATWPGNGIVASGESEQLAPFYDINSDGIYNPEQGDYPLIRGDECIFFMCNDNITRTGDLSALPMKVELHGMVYGFDDPADTALFNTVFVHYDIINHSENNYSNCYAAVYNDFDIGAGVDDYYRTDVQRSSFIGYNSLDMDGDGGPLTYGENPPAQSITVLAGPFMDADGIDNPAGGCDESVNGVNFGNSINDDERYGLSRAIQYAVYDWNWWGNEPVTYHDTYNFMSGFWDDDTPVLYGGNGHVTNGATGPQARYMFPGDSDPLNYGTNCEFPANGYNQGTKFWTEEQVMNPGSDRRGLGSMGPFTFAAGQVQEIELAYCVGSGNGGAKSSFNQLLRNIDSLRNAVANGQIIIPNSSLGFRNNEKLLNVELYPNPASDIIAINIPGLNKRAEYSIFNFYGSIVAGGIITSNRSTLKINHLSPGLYIIRLTDGQSTSTIKFIKK